MTNFFSSINSLVLRELRRLTHRKSSVLSVLALVLNTRTEGRAKGSVTVVDSVCDQ